MEKETEHDAPAKDFVDIVARELGSETPQDRFVREVKAKTDQLRIAEEARKQLAEERAAASFTPPQAYSLAELREAIKDVAKYRIDGLMLANSDTLVVGSYKSGKTTFDLNLVRSLATGEPFLGEYEVTPVDGRILFMNYELPLVILEEWTTKIGIPEDKLLTISPSGSSNPLSSNYGREWLIDYMDSNDVEILFVDPFSAATKGLDVNEQDNTAVRQWLEGSISDVRAGSRYCKEAILSHHTGKDKGKGARGASAFYDWPSSYIELDKQGTMYDSPRYIKASGRDVGINPTKLEFNSETHQLFVLKEQVATGPAVNESLMIAIVEVVNADGQVMNSGQVEKALKDKAITFRKEDIRPAREEAVSRGLIVGGLGKFKTGVGPLGSVDGLDLAGSL